jgi:hypothetical protein
LDLIRGWKPVFGKDHAQTKTTRPQNEMAGTDPAMTKHV